MLRNHITIHCWGGYGSQLFAFALAIDIRSRFPKRKIQFRFHSGGVTQRGIEIINDSELNRFSLTNDFKSNRKKPDTLKFLLDFLKVRTILAKSKIIYEDNIFFDIEKIKPEPSSRTDEF